MEQTEESVNGKILGVPITIRGLNMVVFLTLVAVVSYTIYFLSTIVSDEHKQISYVLQQQTEVLNEQNYILLADEKETNEIRKRMKMPHSLRKKLSNGD